MLLTCIKENLIKGINAVNRSVGKDSSLPILANILLETENGRLKLSATDLEIGITAWVGGKVEKEGKITIPAKLFSEYITNLNAAKINLLLFGNDLKIEAGNSHAVLKGINAEEFPLIPKIEQAPICSVKSGELQQALNQTIFAAATDESRPEIAGIYVKIKDKSLCIAATDSYRLAEKKIYIKDKISEAVEAIIPAKTLSELNRIINNNNEDVVISFSENQIKFTLENIEIISRLVEGQYPDYTQIIPENYNSSSKVEIKEFGRAIKNTSLFSKTEAADVKFSINKKDGNIKISAESGQVGSNLSEIKADVTGQDDEVVFNYRYVLDGLNAQNDSTAIFSTNSDAGPGAILPPKDRDYVYIIMPIKK